MIGQRFRWSEALRVGLAGLEPSGLIRYRGLSAVRTGDFPGRCRASGAKGCVLHSGPVGGSPDGQAPTGGDSEGLDEARSQQSPTCDLSTSPPCHFVPGMAAR
jgi:hypothetical protein